MPLPTPAATALSAPPAAQNGPRTPIEGAGLSDPAGMISDMTQQAAWPCEAYGGAGLRVGAWCFFADEGQRDCATLTTCEHRLATERRRAFQRIQEHVAGGDAVAADLAAEFPSPETLLGGT